MNILSCVIVLLVVVWIYAAVSYMVQKKGGTTGGCSGNCGECASQCAKTSSADSSSSELRDSLNKADEKVHNK